MKIENEKLQAGKSSSDWLTRQELAGELKVALRTIDSWRKRKVISCVKVGRLIRFSRSQVLADLAKYERPAIGA